MKLGDSPGAVMEAQGAFPRGREAARWLPWLALPYAIALALLLARRPDVVGLLHDDGVYLSMARSIGQGLGPVDGHMLADARTSRFPPLHPLLLALARPLLRVRGGDDALAGVHRLVALNGLWLGIALFAFLRWVTRWKRWPPLLALAAAALLFTLPYVIGLAQHLMSESLFLAEILVALLAYERARARGTRGAWLLASALSGLLPATRAAGVAIVAGLALHALATTRSWRRVAGFFGVAAVPWLAAAAWSALSRDVAADSPLFGPSYSRLLLDHLRELPWIAWVNLVRLADDCVNLFATAAPAAAGTASAIARAGCGLVAIVAMVAGVRRSARGRCAPESCVLAASFLLLLPWPFTSVRFLAPLAPLMLVALVESLATLLPRAPRAVAIAAGGGCLAAALWNAPALRRCFAARGDEVPFFFAAPVAAAPLREAGGWLERNSPPDAPFASTLDPAIHFLAHRPGVSAWRNDQVFLESYFDRASRWRELYGGPPSRRAALQAFAGAEGAQRVLAEYRRLGVRHVVVVHAATVGATAAGSFLYDSLADHLVRTDPATSPLFENVFTTGDGSIAIWRFRDVR